MLLLLGDGMTAWRFGRANSLVVSRQSTNTSLREASFFLVSLCGVKVQDVRIVILRVSWRIGGGKGEKMDHGWDV